MNRDNIHGEWYDKYESKPRGGKMNYTELFKIQWDDSYGDPDFAIPGTMEEWLNQQSKEDIERLAVHLEWLAERLRKRETPFKDSLMYGILGHS